MHAGIWWTLLVLITVIAIVVSIVSIHHHTVEPEAWAMIRSDEQEAELTPIYTPVLIDTKYDKVVMITLFLELRHTPDMLEGCRHMLEKYPEMGKRIVMDRQHAYWQDIPGFAESLDTWEYSDANDKNLYRDESVRGPDDLAEFLEHFPAQRIIQKRMPPWQFITFPNYRNGQRIQSAVLCTLHHTHFDGLNAMRFLFHCFQHDDAATRQYDEFLKKFSKPALYNAILHKAQTGIEEYLKPRNDRNVRHSGLPSSEPNDRRPRWILSEIRRRWQDAFFRHPLVAAQHRTKFWWNRESISLTGLKQTIREILPKTSLNDLVVMCVAETMEQLAQRHGYHKTLPMNIRMPVALRNKSDYDNRENGAITLVSRAAFIEIPFGGGGGGGDDIMTRSEKLHHIRRQISNNMWKPTMKVDAMANIAVPFNYLDKFVKDLPPMKQRQDAFNVFLSNVPGAQTSTNIMGSEIERFVFFTKARLNYPLKIQLISYRDTMSLSINAHESFKIPIDEVGDLLVENLKLHSFGNNTGSELD